MTKDFINLADFTDGQLRNLLDEALRDKASFKAGSLPATLERKTLAMIFEKPSLRTRVSFEAAMTQLGGHAIYLTNADIGLGQRESVRDAGGVLGRMCDGIMARTFSHKLVEQLGEFSAVPVINALTDQSHPCQAMADLMTVREQFADLAGRTIAFIGDGNNVARSLAIACAKLGLKFILACPKGYELEPSFAQALCRRREGCYETTNDPSAAVKNADAVYTDTWISMGQEAEKQKRIDDFAAFQLNAELLSAAPQGTIVLHCLPAYRGCEITAETFEAHADTIFRQAENRLHFQRTLLNVLLGRGGIE